MQNWQKSIFLSYLISFQNDSSFNDFYNFIRKAGFPQILIYLILDKFVNKFHYFNIPLILMRNNNNNMSPSHTNIQLEHKKIFCAYHPTQFLTNFCLERQCLMPLCPSCVVEHTQQHYQSKQKPTYINLNQALQEIKSKCYSQIMIFQDFHRINEEIVNYIDGLRNYIHQQLQICKQTVFDHINVLFEEYQSALYKEIHKKYKQANVYDSEDSKEVKNNILQNIQNLYDKASLLKGDQCLSTLIKYYGQDEQIVEDNIHVIQQYLQKNKMAGGIHIGLDQQLLVQTFKNLCQKTIHLNTIHQKDLQNQQTTQPKKSITISSRLKSPFDQKKHKKQPPRKEKNQKFTKDPGIKTGFFKY